MDDMHPLWQATPDEADVPVRPRQDVPAADDASDARRIPIGAPASALWASRLPGAVAGILVVITAGILLVRGGGDMLRELQAMLPATTESALPAGGEEEIGSASSEAQQTSSSARAQKRDGRPLLALAEGGADPFGASVLEAGSSSSASSEPLNSLPLNPYTVNSGVTRVLDEFGQPAVAQQQQATVLHSSAPRQPASGPEAGVAAVFLVALAVLTWLRRDLLLPKVR